MSHVPHPHIEHRKRHGPHKTRHEHSGFNGALASFVTRTFGSMWAFYILVIWMAGWMGLATAGVWIFKLDRYPFPFLLFLSNLVQLWALPVLAVGQQVLSAASDKRAEQTYKDAEAILDIVDDIQRQLKDIASETSDKTGR